jgi:hypothetical protein
MKINTLKDLEKVIKLCRKMGIAYIKTGELELQLGAIEPKPKKIQDLSLDFPEANIKVPTPTIPTETQEQIETDTLTPEQLLFYSSQGPIEQ